jgi:chromosome segregation ATPase
VSKDRCTVTSKLKSLKEKKEDHNAVVDEVEDQVEVYEKLLSKLDDGKTVFAPRDKKNKKRRRGKEASSSSRKKRKSSLDADDDSDFSESESDEAADSDDADDVIEQPLTREQVDDKLDELRTLKKDARRERSNIDDEIRELKKRLAPLKEEEARIDARQSALCIAGRNEYSRSAIQQDYAVGIKEIDQELAEDADADAFDPTKDIRDYEEVARNLPVFCVSSRAYQKLSVA